MSYKKEKAQAQSDTKKYGHYEGKGDGKKPKIAKKTRRRTKKKKYNDGMGEPSAKVKAEAAKRRREAEQDRKIEGALSNPSKYKNQ